MFQNPFRRKSGGLRPRVGLTATLCLLAAGTSGLQAQTLVHRWSFDTLNDSVGTAHATLNGTATLSGGALVLPGGGARTNYASVPISATLSAASSLTVETWFTTNADTNWAKVWMFGTPGGSGDGSKYIDFTPRVGIGTNYPSASFNPGSAETNTRPDPNSATLTTGTQILSTVVYDDPSNQIRLYINGTLADSVAWNGTISQLGTTTQNFIGAPVFYNDGCFNGSVNELRIWSGAMAEAQVTANASAGPGTIAPRDPQLAVASLIQASSSGGVITVNVPITNSATTNTLSVTGATPGGDDAAFFNVTSPLPLEIAPGNTSNLTVAFDPLGETGTFVATLTLASNDAFKAQEVVTLEVEVALPDLNVPAVLNLGPVANNAPAQNFALQVGNTGLGELAVIDAIFIAGPTAPTHFQQFTVGRDFDADGPLLVAPQSSANLPFTFNPAGVRAGIKTGILRLFTDDPDLAEAQIDIPVNVEVTAPAAAENPPVLAHRWSFTTDATDSAGSANAELVGTASVSGGNLVLPGTVGDPAARVNYAKVPIGLTIASSSSMTVETWLKPATTGQTWSKVWMFGTPGGSVEQSTFADLSPHSGITPPAPSTSIRTAGLVADTRGTPPDNPPAPVGDTEYHMVIVFDSVADKISMYIGGVLVDSGTWTGEVFGMGNTVENFIGAAVLFNDRDWAGAVNEMRIWKGALTAANVANSFSSGPNTLPDLNAGSGGVLIGSVQVTGGNIVISGVTGLVNGQSYHLETGVTLQDFAAAPGSTFQGGNPIPTVPATGSKRFVRIVDGVGP
jgi:hypothetical protein